MRYIDNGKDRYWTVEEIRPYIIEKLGEIFPNSIIEREFGKVDIMVHGPKIPVEIQKTYIHDNEYPRMSDFENTTRRQIERDIEDCCICWFFMDKKFLCYLQDNPNLTRSSDIDMGWMYQFWKDRKLRIFTITVDGIIEEMLQDREFDFLRKADSLIKLQRSRYDMAYEIYKSYGFTTEEINSWYDEYAKNTEGLHFSTWVRKKGDRGEIFAKIKEALNNTYIINDMLRCDMKNRRAITHAANLGIIEGNENNKGGGYSKYVWIKCSDNRNMFRHFTGYFEKKELWDYWRTHFVHHDTFVKVVRGEYPNYLRDYNNQKNIEDAWS